jgi:hypothetical protein
LDEQAVNRFIAEYLEPQIARLEGYIQSKQWVPTGSTACAQYIKPLAGELYLFAMLHQAILVKTPAALLKDGFAGCLRAWYVSTLTDSITQRVLTGKTVIGSISRTYSSTVF